MTWTASPSGIISISNTGLATSLAEGQVTLTATSGTISGATQMTVGPAQVKSISINTQGTVILGQQNAVTASATYTDGTTQDVTAKAQWTSSNPLVVAVSSTQPVKHFDTNSGSTPQVTPAQLGIATVTATVAGVSSSSKIVVLGYPRFAFVSNMLNDSVSQYTVNSATGTFRPNGYAYTVTTAFTDCFTIHPSGKFGYAVNFWPQGGQNGAQPSVSIFNIAGDGTLTKAGAPFNVATKPGCVIIAPSGKFAYISSGDLNNISAYVIDAQTGALSAVTSGPWSLSATPTNVVIDPSGQHLYVGTEAGSINGFAIDPSTGSLTAIAGSPFSAFSNGSLVAIEPSGTYAYVTNPNATDIMAFRVDPTTGALNAIKNSSLNTGGLNPQRPVFDRTGQFVYVPNMAADYSFANGNIAAFRIDSASGLLTKVPGSPFTAGQIPKDAALDVDGLGKYLYVTDGNNFVWTYTIDSATGALSYVDKIATRGGVASISLLSGAAPVVYKPNMAWVLSKNEGLVTTFAFDATSVLKPLSTYAVAPGATSLSVERNGSWAYIANPAMDLLYTYGVDANGKLSTFYNFVLTGRGPSYVTVDHSGTAVYLADPLVNSIAAFTHIIPTQVNPFSDPQAGLEVKNITSGAAPSLIMVAPTDSHLFVYNGGDGTVSRYELAPGLGYPTLDTWSTPPSPTQFASGMIGWAFEPSARYLYAITGNTLLGFSIDYSNVGLPVPITNFATISLNQAGAIAADVNGGRIYVADSAGVHAYSITASNGNLTEIGNPTPAGAAPKSMLVDPAGAWLLVVDSTAGVQPFAIDAATGKLTAYPVISAGNSPVAITTDAGKIQ